MQNALSQHAALACGIQSSRSKRVTWRRVTLAKKRWEKRKIGGGDGTLLEIFGKNQKEENIGNCWKIGEKKRKTNKQSLNTIKVPDQTGKTN